MPDISIAQIETAEQIDMVRGLVRDFIDFATTQDASVQASPAFQGIEDQLADLPGIFGPPSGAFLLATVDGVPAGCVAFHAREKGTCEIKRMFVRKQFRGLHLGERLVSALIAQARAQGHKRIVLETFHTLKAAQHLYRKAGFTPCAPFNEVPAHYEGKLVFMEREV